MARGTPKQADDGPAVLIMTRAPRRGEVRRALEPVLGPDGCLALQSALLVLTSQWARRLEPRSIDVAHDPPDAGPELRKLLGDGIAVFPQNGEGISGRLADATARVFARGPGPVMIVWPDVPTAAADPRGRRHWATSRTEPTSSSGPSTAVAST